MTRRYDMIRGAGGGKGGGGEAGRTPQESPDSLRSKQFARVLDLVSEGEIYGLVDGMKSVYLQDTPVQNADGSYNFQGVTLHERTGTQNQGYIPGFPAVESVVAVAVEVKAATPVVRSISNSNISAVRVTINVPQLTYQNPQNGDLGGSSFSLSIDLQSNGGGYVTKISDSFVGKTTTDYQRDYRIELTGSGPWDIRVNRTSPDSTESNRVNAFFWSSYTEITDHKFRYPNSAVYGLEVDASQFSTVPRRGYLLRGIIIKVPTNYDPVTRTYIGTWDGTFKLAYSNNPAWCFYDMVTNSRYGLGDYIDPASADKWALYSIGQYCDELVDDGFGGTEPRFTCNLYLQAAEEAYTVMQHMASVFRGMVYEAGGFITAVQDAPSDPVMLFTPANVIGGTFNYSGSAIAARHTVALVSWNDPADRYQQKVEYVEDFAGIGRYGVRETKVVAFGCTSRGQANRAGRYILTTEVAETDTVTFSAGTDAAYVQPGKIINIADPGVAGVRLGGRVVSATTGYVVVDSPITIVLNHTYELTVQLSDGTLQTRALTNAPGDVTTLTFATALPSAPQSQSIWILSDVGSVEPQMFRVLGILESGKGRYDITAIVHNPSKFGVVDQGLILETAPITAEDYSTQVPVSAVTVTKNTELRQDGSLKVTAVISWVAAINAINYQVELRKDQDNWIVLGNTSALISTYELAQEGTYTARVTAYNVIGTPSTPKESAATVIYWVTLAPPTGLALVMPWVGPDASFRWDLVDGAASYTLEVWNAGILRRTVTDITQNTFTYSLGMNEVDGGPLRTLDIKVKAVGTTSESTYATLSVINPQHGAPVNAQFAAGATSISATVDQSTESDFSAFRFHMGTAPGFTPGSGNLVYEGPNNWYNAVGLNAGQTYYFKVTAYDKFDQSGLAYTAESSIAAGSAGSGIEVSSGLKLVAPVEGDTISVASTGKLWRYKSALVASNVLLNPSAFEQASWVVIDTPTITLNAYTAPDGTTTADDIADSSGAAVQGVQQTVTLTIGQTYLGAICIKKDSNTVTFPEIQLIDGVDSFAMQINTSTGAYAKRIGSSTKYGVIDQGTYWLAWFYVEPKSASCQFSIIPAASTTLGGALNAALARSVGAWGASLTADSTIYGWGTWVDGADILADSILASSLSVQQLSAITADLGAILAGSITFDANSFLRAGQTAFDTGSGLWAGYAGGAYKFSIGSGSGNKLTWDGSVLTVKGQVSGLDIVTGGFVKLGQTAYNTGVGFWLGDVSGVAKFSLGNPGANNYLAWDGSTLIVEGDLRLKSFVAGLTYQVHANDSASASVRWFSTSYTGTPTPPNYSPGVAVALKKTYVSRGGTLRVTWRCTSIDVDSSLGEYIHTYIRVNRSGVYTNYTSYSWPDQTTTTPQTRTEPDTITVLAGDQIELWAVGSGDASGGTDSAGLVADQFRLFSANPVSETSIL